MLLPGCNGCTIHQVIVAFSEVAGFRVVNAKVLITHPLPSLPNCRLELSGKHKEADKAIEESERGKLLELTNQLTAPELSMELQMTIVAQMAGS